MEISNNNYLIKILKGAGIAFIFTIICLTIFALLLVYTNMSENLIQPVIIGVTAISIIIGSLISTKKTKKNGIIKGMLVGLIYSVLIYLISTIVTGGNTGLTVGAIAMFFISLVCGAIGGIIGVNIDH